MLVVELEEERQTDSLQQDEEKEIVVAAKEVEKYLHRWGYDGQKPCLQKRQGRDCTEDAAKMRAALHVGYRRM